MGRIPSDRVGYSGYACVGIATYAVPPMACEELPSSSSLASGDFHNDYLRLPPDMMTGISDAPWENTSALDTDVRLVLITQSCGLDFNPFTGICVDLYRAFRDHGLEGLIEDSCYEVHSLSSSSSVSSGAAPGPLRYETGYSRAQPMMKLSGGCGRA